jgi:hypothetical protein
LACLRGAEAGAQPVIAILVRNGREGDVPDTVACVDGVPAGTASVIQDALNPGGGRLKRRTIIFKVIYLVILFLNF